MKTTLETVFACERAYNDYLKCFARRVLISGGNITESDKYILGILRDQLDAARHAHYVAQRREHERSKT